MFHSGGLQSHYLSHPRVPGPPGPRDILDRSRVSHSKPLLPHGARMHTAIGCASRGLHLTQQPIVLLFASIIFRKQRVKNEQYLENFGTPALSLPLVYPHVIPGLPRFSNVYHLRIIKTGDGGDMEPRLRTYELRFGLIKGALAHNRRVWESD